MLILPTLETQRLTIRPLVPDDLTDIHRILSECFPDPRPSEESLAERREWLDWTMRNYVQLARLYQPPYGERAVVLRATGELIGAVGLVPCLAPFGQLPGFAAPEYRSGQTTPEVGLFWAVSPDHQSKGYASEAARALIIFAFDTLHLAHIIATTEYDNQASQRVMEKIGMRLLGNPLPTPPYLQVVGWLGG
jgi:RimJ/RimL family protein N-acetyltransferase